MQTLKETVFQSTLPARGATRVGVHSGLYCPDFNPRSPHGERRAHAMLCDVLGKFQSTLPARGATRPQITVRASPIFQSTLPARGATTTETTSRAYMRDFNPRSPHGERPGGQARRRNQHPISIHAPRTGSDDRPRRNRRGLRISIHAPRTGSDERYFTIQYASLDFNPRSPHGERRALFVQKGGAGHFNPRSPHGERLGGPPAQPHQDGQFQSTLPARGATALRQQPCDRLCISIHAPRTGSDR